MSKTIAKCPFERPVKVHKMMVDFLPSPMREKYRYGIMEVKPKFDSTWPEKSLVVFGLTRAQARWIVRKINK